MTALWALCNSPFANAYTYAWASKRDITAGLMRVMPVPDLNSCDLACLEAAAALTLMLQKNSPPPTSSLQTKIKSGVAKKGAKANPARDQMHLGLPGQPSDEEIATAKERLRALHWRVDAEVLRLYALPPELERELLDAFDGVPRVGVPFEQTRYIPREFRDVLTLDEFLRITDEWDATEARRCKPLKSASKPAAAPVREEEKEFRQLQRLLMLHRRLYAPLPTAEIKALAKQLKEESAWALVSAAAIHSSVLSFSLDTAKLASGIAFVPRHSAMPRSLLRGSFTYPSPPHVRKHGPMGYPKYGHYHNWLRDEFTFTCVYCIAKKRGQP